jgi:hypothetical protein
LVRQRMGVNPWDSVTFYADAVLQVTTSSVRSGKPSEPRRRT